MASKAVKAPASFWAIAGLSMLWNVFGAVDYTLTQMGNEAYLANFSAEERAYFASFPSWHVMFWAVGVWGSVMGSLLLLLRRRSAMIAFVVSAAGLFVTTVYSGAQAMPETLQGEAYWGMSALIWMILLALVLYSRRAMQRGWIA